MAFIAAPAPLELMMILVLALLVLGPKRLPEAARSVGRGMRELRDSLQGTSENRDYDELDDEDEDDEEPGGSLASGHEPEVAEPDGDNVAEPDGDTVAEPDGDKVVARRATPDHS